MLATLVDRAPEGSEWVFESKLDGYRILAEVRNGRAKLHSRRGSDWSARFEPIGAALEKIPGVDSALFDGELVALNDKGISEFQLLQNSLDADGGSERDNRLYYYIFDLLELNGEDLRARPLDERKLELERLLAKNNSDHVRFCEHRRGDGEKLFKQACKSGLEGIIAKRRESPYRGGRGEDWVKVKCTLRQEFVIVGYTDPQGAREKFGALLLATREKGEALRFVGKVGTGFSRETLSDLSARLKKLKAKASPFEESIGSEKGVHWVKPDLVAEITFTGWTNDSILRHPSFEGLREDKRANEVKVERAKKLSESRVRLTHPDKVLFADEGITKAELADYLELVSERMLPYVENRPLAFMRCPAGREKACFFQQHYQPGLGAEIDAAMIREVGNKKAPHPVIHSKDGLRALAQVGVLEIHTWAATADQIETPDQLVFDFDPDPTTEWKDVVKGIRQLKDFLEELELTPFLKLSGGKGVHIHVPLEPEAGWEEFHDFAEAIALEMTKRLPKTFTASSLKKDRKGLIYLDYVRNSRGTTFIAPYSTRARAGAPVALPVFWDELSPKLKPNEFNLRNVAKRLAKVKDNPWKDFYESRGEIKKL